MTAAVVGGRGGLRSAAQVKLSAELSPHGVGVNLAPFVYFFILPVISETSK